MDINNPEFDPREFFDRFRASVKVRPTSVLKEVPVGLTFTDVDIYLFCMEHGGIEAFGGRYGNNIINYAREIAFIWKAAGLIEEIGKLSGANNITYRDIKSL